MLYFLCLPLGAWGGADVSIAGWPRTLILLLLAPKGWDYRCKPLLSLYSAADGIHCSVCSVSTLPLSRAPSLVCDASV